MRRDFVPGIDSGTLAPDDGAHAPWPQIEYQVAFVPGDVVFLATCAGFLMATDGGPHLVPTTGDVTSQDIGDGSGGLGVTLLR